MSIVYVAGKMAGLPNKGKEKFYAAAKALREEGEIVLNPAELPEGLPGECYMPICLAMINAADIVYALDNWRDSPGARLEIGYAAYQGKTVIEEDKTCSMS